MTSFAIVQVVVAATLLNGHVAENIVIKVDVDVLHKIVALDHFWESTGLCPPLPHSNASRFLLETDMQQNLLLIASTPHSGIKQVRIHWLLELISKDKNAFNFTNLDNLVKFLYTNNLYPGFELMGNPSGIFSDFDNFTQVLHLKTLVTQLAQRYIKLFGLDYVAKWNFESWNEPDHKDFDTVKMSVPGFLKYYDACSEGLKEVDFSLVFGGPGGSCKDPSYSKRCWALMAHCINGTNYITGDKGSRIDFISIHKKGGGKAENILNGELSTIKTLHSNYSQLTNIPIYNDEADPLVGWNKPEWWRADSTYAALIVKVIALHQNKIIAKQNNIKYTLLSNDNGFLSYAPHFFTQRTLNARFQINNTDPKYVHFIKKPSLIVMGLLAKLGDMQIAMNISSNSMATVGGIASICVGCKDLEVSTILYNSLDTKPISGKTIVQLNFFNLSQVAEIFYAKRRSQLPRDVKLVMCEVNNWKSDPHALWKEMGSPVFPTNEQLKLLHDVEGPDCSEPLTVYFDSIGSCTREILFPLPGIMLHQICWKPAHFKDGPVDLKAFKINKQQVLLTWSDRNIQTKCIKTFLVKFAHGHNKSLFITINYNKLLFTSFVFISNHTIVGSFKVQAVDIWDRKSQFSEIIYFY